MTLQIVASLIDAVRGVIYDCHMFIVQATEKYKILTVNKIEVVVQSTTTATTARNTKLQLLIKLGNWVVVFTTTMTAAATTEHKKTLNAFED